MDSQHELALLATAIASKEKMAYLLERCEEKDFANPDNRIIFKAVRRSPGIGLYELATDLRRAGLTGERTQAIIADISVAPPVSAFSAEVNALLEVTARRDIHLTAEKAIAAVKGHASVDEILALLSDGLAGVTRDDVTIKPVFSELDLSASTVAHVRTEFPNLDDALTGLFGGQLITVGARPRVGKSVFLLQLCRAAVSQGYAPIFFSLEMLSKNIALRCLTQETGIPVNKMRSAGSLSDEEVKTIYAAYDEMKKENFAVVDSVYDSAKMIPISRRHCEQHRKAIIFVDYLQLIKSAGGEKRYEQIGNITRLLKLLAMEYEIPVVVASQLNRLAEGQRPSLSELRESGNIENDSDVVILLHREKSNDEILESMTDCIIAKNRDGGMKCIDMYFDKHRLKFQEA